MIVLDGWQGKPLEEVLRAVSPTPRMVAALTGPLDEKQPLSAIYHLVRAYEGGDWPAVAMISEKLALAVVDVAQAYRDAVAWADGIFSASGRHDNRAA